MFGEKCRAAEANILCATEHAHATHGVKNTEKEHCFLAGYKRKNSALVKMLNWQYPKAAAAAFHYYYLFIFFLISGHFK